MVDFSVDKPKEKSYGRRFLRLKASSKGTPDVFTGSSALRKMLLTNLSVKMLQEQYI